MKNFFISYNKVDRDCAVWIHQQLRGAGYTTTIQAAEMPPGLAFVHEMDKAVEENEGLIAVLSPDYLIRAAALTQRLCRYKLGK